MDENINNIENSSFIYDIINSQSNFTLFFFSVLFVITILVFSSIKITFTLFVGLIIYVLFIKYYSTINDKKNKGYAYSSRKKWSGSYGIYLV